MTSNTFEISITLGAILALLGMFAAGLRAYVTIHQSVQRNREDVQRLQTQLNNGIRDRITEAEQRLARLEAHHEARESRQRRRQNESDS